MRNYYDRICSQRTKKEQKGNDELLPGRREEGEALPAVPTVDPDFSSLEVTASHFSRSSVFLKDYTPFSTANKSGGQSRNSVSKASKSRSTQPKSLDWLDIERMLDMATLRSCQTETQSKSSSAHTSFLALTERNPSEESATPLDSPGYILPSTAARLLQLPPPSASPFRRRSPMDIPKDLTPVRLSFSSASVAANSPIYDGRFIASLVFEGLDDISSQRSGSVVADARSRKVIEERSFFTSRKKVILVDDVSDSDDREEEERKSVRVDRRKGLMFKPSIAGGPGSHVVWKTL